MLSPSGGSLVQAARGPIRGPESDRGEDDTLRPPTRQGSRHETRTNSDGFAVPATAERARGTVFRLTLPVPEEVIAEEDAMGDD